MATMYALKKAWEVVGVDAKNFLWYTPIQFEGGPYYQLLNTVLASTNVDSYEGQRARGELKNTLPRLFFPAYGEINSLYKAGEALGNGSTWEALLHALSLPVDETMF